MIFKRFSQIFCLLFLKYVLFLKSARIFFHFACLVKFCNYFTLFEEFRYLS